MKDVNITAILQSKKEKVVSTDINGGFSFIMLKPGTYKLVFEKEGYKKVIKEKVEVKEKTPLQINVEVPQFIPSQKETYAAFLNRKAHPDLPEATQHKAQAYQVIV